jgi:hypothetical protein
MCPDAIFDNSDSALARLNPDGRILAAVTKGATVVLARLWPDGTTLDTGGQQTHGQARARADG